MISSFVFPARFIATGAYVVGGLLSGCNSPVVNPGPTQTPPAHGPVFPESAEAYPEVNADEAVTVRPPTESSFYHEVKAGETLGKIAGRYGVTVDDLVRGNGLGEPDTIQPGQLIYIPGRPGSAQQ